MQSLTKPSSRLLLIGYRGTGKTAVARRIAEQLGEDWIDTDAEIEHASGRTIVNIFSESGEEEFRNLETEVLRRAKEGSYRLLALGGGIVLRKENRQMLREMGTTILLQATPETIFARLTEDPTTDTQRPNLTARGGLEEIVELLEARRELYEQCANMIVDTDLKSLDQVADEVLTRSHFGPREEI
jgi:shikimate kinase